MSEAKPTPSKRKPRERFSAKLVAVATLAPGVRSLTFEANEPIAFASGQWLNVYLDEDNDLVRSYSIASPGGEATSTFDFAITRVEEGPVSNAMHALEVGAELEFDGAWGVFTARKVDPERPVLFVATGTGLSPIRALLKDRLEAKQGETRLLFGCRTSEDVLWREEMEAAVEEGGLSYLITLSQPGPGHEGRSGYVQTHLKEALEGLDDPFVFICGRTPMVHAVRNLLKEEYGFDRKAIRTERYD